MSKTYIPSAKDITRNWHLIDAKDQVLGRLSSQVVKLLMGKHKPSYTPNLDSGDYVVIINADQIAVTGSKMVQKKYYHHSGFPGGLSTETLASKLERKPTQVLEIAIKGMLPKNRLAQLRMRRLKVYAGSEHPYTHQVTHS